MPAVICDVDQDILGFDFLDRFKLGFEWEGDSDLKLVDKKSSDPKVFANRNGPEKHD